MIDMNSHAWITTNDGTGIYIIYDTVTFTKVSEITGNKMKNIINPEMNHDVSVFMTEEDT